MKDMLNKIILGDCLDVMKGMPDKCVDMILCDLPYGTSACGWDTVIPFDILWEQYSRIIKNNGVIALCGQEPFSSVMRLSNIKMYKYDWKWIKDNATNFLNKKFQPGKITEDICIFSNGASSFTKTGVNMVYNPQLEKGKPYKTTNNVARRTNAVIRSEITNVLTDNDGTRLPNNVIYFNRDKDKIHPTQKPVALMEYLIKTYTKENELVLDNCIGSGTTAIAAIRTGRQFIGIEKDPEYHRLACERVEKEQFNLFK